MIMKYNNLQSLISNLKTNGIEKEDIIKAVNEIYQPKKENNNDKNHQPK